MTDARDGYHSVPLRAEDRHQTTFITPWGRHRYCVAPQASNVSGDAYARRYNEVIADVKRKTKCLDDTALWDEELEYHWWRIIDFLELVGHNGLVLSFHKFQPESRLFVSRGVIRFIKNLILLNSKVKMLKEAD